MFKAKNFVDFFDFAIVKLKHISCSHPRNSLKDLGIGRIIIDDLSILMKEVLLKESKRNIIALNSKKIAINIYLGVFVSIDRLYFL